jgi:RNA polymerase sigma-70 factor (ECF subfamily)
VEDFAELVDRHQAMVFRTLARLTGERDGLEDMAQEAFLRLFRALPQFRGEAQIATFLYRIMVNLVNDEFRRRQQARMAVPVEDEAGELKSPWPGPEEMLGRGEMQQAVDTALGRLDANQRAILVLHYQEGRSYEEIAAILDAPMGTVKTHLYRARQRLKDMLKEGSRCHTK